MGIGGGWCLEKVLVPCGPPLLLRTQDMSFPMIIYFKSEFLPPLGLCSMENAQRLFA